MKRVAQTLSTLAHISSAELAYPAREQGRESPPPTLAMKIGPVGNDLSR